MKLRDFVGFHRGTNNLTFCYMKLSCWVSGYRCFDRQWVSQFQTDERRIRDYARWTYNNSFSSKSAGTHYPKTRGPKKVGFIEDDMGQKCGMQFG